MAPSGWRVASALDETPGGALEARGYEALIDAPIEVGRFAEAERRAAGRTYRVVLDGAPEVPPSLLRDLAAVAEAEAKLAGPPPYKRYLLIIHLADGIGRIAALEHAASTSVLVPARALSGGEPYDELLYVIAHELFHVIQFSYLPSGAIPRWVAEGSASGMALAVYPSPFDLVTSTYLDRWLELGCLGGEADGGEAAAVSPDLSVIRDAGHRV